MKQKQERGNRKRLAPMWESWRMSGSLTWRGPLTVGGLAGTERDLWGIGGEHSNWPVEVRQSKTYVNGSCRTLCTPAWVMCLLVRRGVECCKWSLEQFVQHMVKVLWLMEYVKSGLQSFMLKISLWMMLIDRVEQLKLIVIKSTP